MAVLKITTEEGPPRQAELGESAVVVGRWDQCQIHLPLDDISSKHCRIEPTAEGWVVVDLGSKNGTYLGDERIDRHLLKNGDELRIGAASLKFYTDVAAIQAQRIEREAQPDIQDVAPSPPIAFQSEPGEADGGGEPVPTPREESASMPAATQTTEAGVAAAAEVPAVDGSSPTTSIPVAAPPPVAESAPGVTEKKKPTSPRGANRPLWDLANTNVPPSDTGGPAVDSSKLLGLELRGKSAIDREKVEAEQEEKPKPWYRTKIPTPLFYAIAALLVAWAAWRFYIELFTI